MSDQAKKLRSIINQQLNDNSQSEVPTETNEAISTIPQVSGNEHLSLKEDFESTTLLQSQDEVQVSKQTCQSPKPIVSKSSNGINFSKQINFITMVSNQSQQVNILTILKTAIHLHHLGENVCIIDVDGNLMKACISSHEQIPTLTDVVNQNCLVDDAMLNVSNKIKVIKSGDFNFNQISNLEDVSSRLEFLKEFDFILINVGTDINHISMIPCMMAEDLVIMSSPEIEDIKETYALLKTLDKHNIKPVIHVLFNQVTNITQARRGFNLLVDLTQKFLDLKILSIGCIRQVSNDNSSLKQIRLLATKIQKIRLSTKQSTSVQDMILKLIQLSSK